MNDVLRAPCSVTSLQKDLIGLMMGRIMNRHTNRSSKFGFRWVSVACMSSECGFCNVYKLSGPKL